MSLHNAIAVITLLAALAASGCRRDALAQSSPPPASRADAGLSRSEVNAPSNALCLPLVADVCGCVSDCAIGWIDADRRRYEVHHRFWDHGQSVMHAGVSPWCVGRDCTRAFHVDIVCDGVCPRRPADHSCHWEGDICASARH
jgi:hypothetical protein